MAEMMLPLKQGPFHIRQVINPEQLHQTFTKYISNFKEFLIATGAEGHYTTAHVHCGGCKKIKVFLRLMGGDEMKMKILFDFVGGVTHFKQL